MWHNFASVPGKMKPNPAKFSASNTSQGLEQAAVSDCLVTILSHIPQDEPKAMPLGAKAAKHLKFNCILDDAALIVPRDPFIELSIPV